MKKLFAAAVALQALSILAGAVAYPRLPETLASHWNAYGAPNGYMPKNVSLFIMPAVFLAIVVLLYFLPNIDPLKRNIDSFRKQYDMFILAMSGFLAYINVLSIAWNLFGGFDFVALMAPGFSLLFFSLGTMLSKSKRNWFIGIRTPWTLESDIIWEKTHSLAGRLFMISAVAILPVVFVRGYALFFLIAPIAASALAPAIYSYVLYKKGQ